MSDTDQLCTAAECNRPTPDAYLCNEHTHRLEQTLDRLPDLLAELDVTRTRTDRIAPAQNRARRTARTDTDIPCWCGCTRPETWHHVKRHGHTHSPATTITDRSHARPELGSHGRLPISDQGAEAATIAENTLTTWCRHLVTTRGVTLAVLPREDLIAGPFHAGCMHPSCETIRAEAVRPALTIRLAQWLRAKVGSIRMDEGAGEILYDLEAVLRRIRHVVDRPPDRVYAGPCSSTTAPLGVDPDDEGCCALDLYVPLRFLADPEHNAIVCDGWNSDDGQGCGGVHTYADRRGFLLDSLERYVAPMAVLLPVLCQFLPAPEPSRQARSNWLARGVVRVVSTGADGVPWVSGADLAAQLRRYQPMPQRATRRGRMAS